MSWEKQKDDSLKGKGPLHLAVHAADVIKFSIDSIEYIL